MRIIDAEDLLNDITKLEKVALERVARLGPLSDIDPGEFNRWSSILQERTAFKHDLMDAPIIDTVPVMRCKDCKHCTYDDKQLLYLCDYTPFDNYVQVMPLDYCSWGERREEEP